MEIPLIYKSVVAKGAGLQRTETGEVRILRPDLLEPALRGEVDANLGPLAMYLEMRQVRKMPIYVPEQPQNGVQANGHTEPAKTTAKVKATGHKGTFTQVPNIVFELPARLQLEQSAFCVLVHLCRLTYGMHAPELTTNVGLAHLAELTGMSKTTLVHALAVLDKHKLIARTRRTDKFGRQATTAIKVTLPEG